MDLTLLILAITLPLIIPISLCFAVQRKTPFTFKNWGNIFSIKENKWLLSQPLFWCSLGIPLCMFLSFGSLVWIEYKLVMTKEGFDTFLNISKLPLWLLAIAAPFSVVIARAHSTAQTAKQISELIHKNKSDDYFSHRKEFLEHFKNKKCSLTNHPYNLNFAIYRYIYSGSQKHGSGSFDGTKYMRGQYDRLSNLKETFEQFSMESVEDYDALELYVKMIIIIQSFSVHFDNPKTSQIIQSSKDTEIKVSRLGTNSSTNQRIHIISLKNIAYLIKTFEMYINEIYLYEGYTTINHDFKPFSASSNDNGIQTLRLDVIIFKAIENYQKQDSILIEL